MSAKHEEPHDDLRGRLVRSAMWVTLDKWGSRFSQLIVFALLARMLDARDFGLVALAAAVIAFTTPLVDQALSKALIQRENLEKEHCDAAFWTAMGVSCLLAGALAAIAGPLANLLDDEGLAEVIRWLSLSLPLSAIQATPAALMERNLEYRGLTIRHLIGTVCGGIIGVVMALLGAGVWSLVGQALGAAAVASAVLWRVSDWRPAFTFSPRHFHELWAFGSQVLGMEMIGLLNQHSDRFIVGAALGPRALGFYHVGLRIISIAADTMTAVVAQVALPGFSRLQSDRERLRRAFYAATRISVTVAVPVFALLAVAAPLLIPLVFGPGWERSVPVMQALAGMGVINAAVYFDRAALLAVGAGGSALRITAVQAAINVAAAIVTVRWGIFWTALGVTLRQYLVWPLRLYIVRRHIGIEIQTYMRPWLTAVGATAVMVGILLMIREIASDAEALGVLAILGAAGAFSYVAIMQLVAASTVQEIRRLVRR